MGRKRTLRNKRTKSERYKRQRGGDETVQSTSSENKKEESIGEKFLGIVDNVSEWFSKPEWFPSASSSQTAGKRRRRKHRRTYKK